MLEQKYKFFDGAFEHKKKKFAFCVFSSKATIKLIKEHIPLSDRHILMDATFRVVPIGQFNQLFILYIRKNDKVKFYYFVLFLQLFFFVAFANAFLFQH